MPPYGVNSRIGGMQRSGGRPARVRILKLKLDIDLSVLGAKENEVGPLEIALDRSVGSVNSDVCARGVLY